MDRGVGYIFFETHIRPPPYILAQLAGPSGVFFFFFEKSLRVALGSGTRALGTCRKITYGGVSAEGISETANLEKYQLLRCPPH